MKKYCFITIISVLLSMSMHAQADLSLEMSVDPSQAAVGQTVVFTIVLTNDGPDQATGITVLDRLPSGFEYIEANTTLGVYAPASGIWTIGGISPSGSAQLTLQAEVKGGGNHTNLAEVTASDLLDYDSTPGNGVDTDGDGIVVDDANDEDDGDGQVVIVGGEPRNCLAPVDALSTFTANPTEPINTVFKFDYKIEAVINFEMDMEGFNTEFSRGDPTEMIMEYYVNSADGSILLPGGTMGFFKTNFRFPTRFGRIDAAVWLPNGQMVVYGYDEEENLHRAVTRESIQSADGRQGMDYFNMMQFFSSSEALAESAEPPPSDVLSQYGTVAAYKGRYAESFTGIENTWHLYFDTSPTPIKTSCIMMGFMVGVLKDARATKCNRLLVYSKVNIGGEDSGESMEARLKSIVPAGRTFNATSYLPLIAGGDTGTNAMATMQEYESRMRDLQLRRQTLQRERERCMSNACRDDVDEKLEENRMDRSRLICEGAVAMGMEESFEECMSKEE